MIIFVDKSRKHGMSGKLVSIVAAGNVSAGKVGCKYLIGRARALHLHPCIVLFTFQMRPRISKRGAEELSVGPSFRKNYHVLRHAIEYHQL